MKNKLTVFLTMAIIFMSWTLATAQWSSNPTINTLISPAGATQPHYAAEVISDGFGGVFVCWQRGALNEHRILLQRLDASGITAWEVEVCSTRTDQKFVKMISDGEGGVVIAWHEYRGSGSGDDIYAQRIDASAQILWGADGKEISTSSTFNRYVSVAVDASGTVVFAWDSRRRIRVKAISLYGNSKWETTATNDTLPQFYPSVIYSGLSDAIIAWQQNSPTGSHDVYVQLLDVSGNKKWGENGKILANTSELEGSCSVIEDGASGCIVGWQALNQSQNTGGIFLQRINVEGNAIWNSGGVPISTLFESTMYNAFWYDVVEDDQGGAIIAWQSNQTGTHEGNDIFVQRIRSDGTKDWGDNGVVVSNAASAQTAPKVVSDGSGGAIVTWLHDTHPMGWGKDIYAQKFNVFGEKQWGDDGEVICTQGEGRYRAEIVSDASAGGILVWEDHRNQIAQIYAQQISWDGNLGNQTANAKVDGFNFKNSREDVWPSGEKFPDWELFEAVYGRDQIYFDNGQVRMEADQYFRNKMQGYWGGSCFGFTHTASKFIEDDLYPWDFGSLNSVFNISHGENIVFAINKNQFHQPLYRADGLYPMVAGVNKIYEALRDNIDEHYNLCFRGWSGGHSVLPRYVTEVSDLEKRIYVYDNNHPGDNNVYFKLRFDTAEPLWEYAPQGWSGGDNAIFLFDYGEVEERPLLPLATNIAQNLMTLHHLANNRVLVKDAQDRRLGWENDDFYSEIPDCGQVVPFFIDTTNAIQDYELVSGNYSVQLRNMGDLPGDFSITSNDYVQGFQNIHLQKTEKYLQVNIAPDLKLSSFTTSDTSSSFVPYFIMNHTNKAEEISYIFTKLFVKIQEELNFTIDDNQGTIAIENQGEEKSYQISFSYGDPDPGVVQYNITPVVSITSGETQEIAASFDPQDNRYASFTISRDFNSDGMIDDSLQFSTTITDVKSKAPTIIIRSVLLANYPNPFNAQTTIYYAIPENCRVNLVVYDILGRTVRSMVDTYQTIGEYRIIWDGKNARGVYLPSGVYFAALRAGENTRTIKMLLVK